MLILDRYRLGTIVSQRRMIFLATDSNSGRPVWVHVIADPADAVRAEIVRRAQAYIQAAGGHDLEDFLEYGYHDKTHYVITASRPECKELGPYLDTLLALRGINVPRQPVNLEATASGTIADDRTQEITSRLRRVGDSAANRPILTNAASSGIRPAQPPPQDRTMSSQPTMFLNRDDVRHAVESAASSQQAAESRTPTPSDQSRTLDSPDETETTLRFVRPDFTASETHDTFDPDQTAKIVSPWKDKKAPAGQRPERVPSRPAAVPSEREAKKSGREYPVWAEQARLGTTETSPPNAAQPAAVSVSRVPRQPADDSSQHKNGSGSHKLVLPPVRRTSPAMASPAMAPPDLGPGAEQTTPKRAGDSKLLYMTLALVMVSLAAIALGLGWYIHTTAPVSAPPTAAVAAPAAAGGAADSSGSAQPGASAPASPAQPVPQQASSAAISPLLLSIAFISAVLIFAAVVVLFMAVKKGI